MMTSVFAVYVKNGSQRWRSNCY